MSSSHFQTSENLSSKTNSDFFRVQLEGSSSWNILATSGNFNGSSTIFIQQIKQKRKIFDMKPFLFLGTERPNPSPSGLPPEYLMLKWRMLYMVTQRTCCARGTTPILESLKFQHCYCHDSNLKS